MSDETDRSEKMLEPSGPRPRWVKVSLLIVAGLVLLFVVLQLLGVGPKHGPGRHSGPHGMSAQAPLLVTAGAR